MEFSPAAPHPLGWNVTDPFGNRRRFASERNATSPAGNAGRARCYP